MTGVLWVVNSVVAPSRVTPQDTLRPKRASASAAIAMRSVRVVSRKASASPGGGSAPVQRISSSSHSTAGSPSNQPSGTFSVKNCAI